MSWRLTDPEFEHVRRATPAERLKYLVNHVADERAIWSLRNADGWVVGADDDGRELVPVWPHQRYAAAEAVGPWADTKPARIALRDWLQTWTPGMTRDGRLVAVFPASSGDEAAMDPGLLADALREAAARSPR